MKRSSRAVSTEIEVRARVSVARSSVRHSVRTHERTHAHERAFKNQKKKPIHIPIGYILIYKIRVRQSYIPVPDSDAPDPFPSVIGDPAGSGENIENGKCFGSYVKCMV